MRDSIPDLPRKLRSRFASEKNNRVLASDILAPHFLVRTVRFDDDALSISFSSDERGKIDSRGQTYMADPGANWDDWSEWPPPPPRTSVNRTSGGPSWGALPSGGLDDETPF